MTTTQRTNVRSVSPHNKKVIGEFPCASEAAVEQAVNFAWQTFRASRLDLETRLAMIQKLRGIVAAQADEIAALISTEVGKPILECYSAEIAAVLDTCSWLVKNAPQVLATKRMKLGNPLARFKKCYLTYEPLGVIGIISPWNFPFSIPMSSVLAAIAAGNTVVLKPSEKSTLIGLKIQELVEAAGFPEGTVKVVVGDGPVGKHLSQQRLSRLILTGSVRAGQRIVEQTAPYLTPLTLELGGKDAAIVMPDAPIRFTAKGLVWGAFFNAGQACASIERVYVVKGPNTQALIDAVVEETGKLRVGSPEDTKTEVGPIIDQMQLDKIDQQVQEAKRLGAIALTGGSVLGDREGFFFAPTVLTNVNHSMLVMKEETFGPVLPIMVVESVEEAIRLANDSTFGLTASIWSASTDAARALAPRLEVGTVYINECIFSHAAPELPWGGVKLSGIGRSHSHIGLLDMVNTKNVNVDTAGGGGRLWWYPYSAGRIRTMKGGVQLLHGSFPWGRLKGLFDFLTGFIRG